MPIEATQSRLHTVLGRIAAAARQCGRDPAGVRLLAVSKTFPADSVRDLAACGQRDFGENYVQEAGPKIDALRDLGLTWHFIGPLQANKTRDVATRFDWVHGIDRLRIARRLSEQRLEAGMPPLQVCLQVNVSGESSKSGVEANELPELAAEVGQLPGLRLRGLMCIPAATDDPQAQRAPFARLRALRDDLTRRGIALDTLSMGMSADLEAGVLEGATIVRVGSALFGARSTQQV